MGKSSLGDLRREDERTTNAQSDETYPEREGTTVKITGGVRSVEAHVRSLTGCFVPRLVKLLKRAPHIHSRNVCG